MYNRKNILEYEKKRYPLIKDSVCLKLRTKYSTDTNYRTKILNKVKDYSKKNPHKVTEVSNRKRARLQNAMPPWLTEEHKKQIKEIYTRAYELTISTGVPHHVDHIIPLAGKNVCGLHVPWNPRVITAKENISKGNRLQEALVHN